MKNRIREIFREKTFFKSVLKVGSGNLIGQTIAIVTTPILSRIYSDVAYGDKAIIVSTAAIICNLATIGLNSAIMKPEDNEEAKKVFSTAFYLNIFVSVAICASCLALNHWFRLIDVTGSYEIAIVLLLFYMMGNTTKALMLIYTNRRGRYNRLFFNPIIGAIANIVLAIPLGLIGFGYEGFLITTIVSDTIQIVHMGWKDIPIYRHYRVDDFKHVLKEYREYIFYQYPSNFLMNMGNEYPTQFLGRCFSAEELGSYSMCLSILKYPMRLISGPISTVYFRTATEYHRQGKDLADFTYKLVSKILLYSFMPVAICCVFSEKIFIFALGASWGMAGTIAAIKAVEYVMLFCSDCVSYCRVSIGKQRSNLIYTIIKLVTIICFSYIGYSTFHSLLGTITMITVGNTLLNIFDMSINFYHLNRKLLIKYIFIAFSYTLLIVGVIVIKYIA